MGGTAYAKIDAALQSSSPYTSFRTGNLSTIAYQKWVEDHGALTTPTLNQDQLNLSARFPHDKHDFVRRAIAQCHAHDLINSESYDAIAVDQQLGAIDTQFSHGSNLTYIFPEESALLYALVRNARPRRAAFMGSYYGYWAMAAKAAASDMEVTLVDINGAVMQLARENFQRLGLDAGVDFSVGDAEALAAGMAGVDLLVLDAEGPKSVEVPEDYRDKAIYYPHLKAALSCLAPGALVVVHNVILGNFTGGKYFEEKQQNYRRQYSKFLPLLQEHFLYTIVDSSEGVLIARKR